MEGVSIKVEGVFRGGKKPEKVKIWNKKLAVFTQFIENLVNFQKNCQKKTNRS